MQGFGVLGEMYTCKVLVKHGVVLVGGASSRSSHRDNLHLATTSETSTSATAPPLFSVRALAKSFPKFGAGQAAPNGSYMGDWERVRHSFGTALARSRSGANRSSISLSRPRSTLEGVDIVRESPKDDPPKFDVSSNCVTPVFRVSPFIQKISVIFGTVVCYVIVAFFHCKLKLRGLI